VAVVAHCLLNVNTKVHGLAVYPAVHPVVGELLATGVGLVQLPCPEVAHLGMARWGMTREQYDIPAYRRLCQKLVEPIVDTLTALVADGCEVVGVWGVDGSPSCGVDRTCVGYEGGEVERLLSLPCCVQVPEEGVFISILRSSLVKRGLELSFHAVPEDGA
jgi:predicted secreted protein